MTVPEVYRDDPDDAQEPEVSKRSRGVAFLLSFFGGVFGLHRFYVAKPRTAIVMLLTSRGISEWYLCDLVLIAARDIPDTEHSLLRDWAIGDSSYAHHRPTTCA